ncbi:MAG: RidA family protein [Bryobacteraceae bacterium]
MIRIDLLSRDRQGAVALPILLPAILSRNRTLAALMVLTALTVFGRDAVVPKVGPKPVGPYSPGIMVNGTLYVSGQGMRRPDGSVPTAFDEQARQCLENVKAIVEAGGLTLEHVVYSQVYLADMSKEADFEKVWAQYFPKNPPARAMLGVYRMPTDTKVEVNAVAIKDLSKKKAVGGTVNGIPAAVFAGEKLYVSGVIGKDLKTGERPADLDAQVQLALDQMRQTLKAAGMDFRHMVFINPYLTKEMPMEGMNKVYSKHFEFGNTPARATIFVNGLPGGANIEFTGVGIKDLKKRRAVRPKNMPPSPTASPCVWADDTFYCSAKSGFIPGLNGGIWAEDVENQVRQSMRNLLDGLEEAGLDFSHVVKSNVYVDNLDEFSKMNAVYGKYFTSAPPTRTTVQPLAPVERSKSSSGHSPKLEEVSIVAVKEKP